jgi:hypothetical protein
LPWQRFKSDFAGFDSCESEANQRLDRRHGFSPAYKP